MKDIAPELLEKIRSEFEEKFESNKKIKELYKKIKAGKADYNDAQNFAYETGRLLAEAFNNNLSSDILPDGRLYYNIANRVIPEMLELDHNIVSSAAAEVQKAINKDAGIGIKAVKPELNTDKVDGIVNIVSGKANFDDIKYMLIDPVINFSQCIVDYTVQANAKQHYKAGLNPKIRRTTTGECCKWCSDVAGTLDYEEAKKTKDIFRRHKHCRCLVEYLPGDGRRQDIHTKAWSREVNDSIQIANNAQRPKKRIGKEVKFEYFNEATPNKGEIIIQADKLYDRKQHAKEIATAKLLHNILGGNIKLIEESNIEGVKTPDYLWRDKLWDLKSTTTEKAANSAIRSGLKQIKDNPGGIILNYEKNDIDMERAIDVIEKRMSKSYNQDNTATIDIMIIRNDRIEHVLRY